MYGEYRPDEAFCDECGVPFLPCDCTVAEMRRGAIATAVLKLPPERLHAEGLTADGLMCFVDSLIEERRGFIKTVRECIPDVRGGDILSGAVSTAVPPGPRFRTIAEVDELLRRPGSVRESEDMVTSFMDLVYTFMDDLSNITTVPSPAHVSKLKVLARNLRRLMDANESWATQPGASNTRDAKRILRALEDPDYFDNIKAASK